jgi:hypothetical protein
MQTPCLALLCLTSLLSAADAAPRALIKKAVAEGALREESLCAHPG